jgi:glucose-1-phosphate cytidylyltransferase
MKKITNNMKDLELVILAGGLGTRISEESYLKPKPMIEIGGKPIIWHIMKYYSSFGINNFIICLGYKGYIIKEFFNNYIVHNSDYLINLKTKSKKSLNQLNENWKITLIDTGHETMTGGRLKNVSKFIKGKNFCFTYGDGLSNINLKDQVKFHIQHGKLATIAAVKPPGRYGSLKIKSNSNTVASFIEKPQGDNSWINGGFFVLNKKVINLIKDSTTTWEDEPLNKLSASNQLMAFKHDGFWQPMDTLRDKNNLEKLWNTKPPWKRW